ncbi:MAG: squalene/phytoene synthase family protein, partial [Pseudomonadota bacterium]
KTPLKAWVGLTYLICRVLDTVEDAPWAQKERQIEHFDRFNKFLLTNPKPDEVKAWAADFPSEIPEGEKLLLNNTYELFEDLHRAPGSVREIITQMVLSMSNGMRFFVESKQSGVLKLSTLSEVNQYCFFVAGVVGEALARLVEHIEPKFQETKMRLVDAHNFGLFLQKVNLLKDQITDKTEGREFVHSRKEIEKSLEANAFGAYRFLRELPLEQREFRLFCAWSLFLGLASLPWLEKGFAGQQLVKLPRGEAEQIFASVEDVIDDPVQVQELFEALMGGAGLRVLEDSQYEATRIESGSGPEDWFHKAYRGELESSQLAFLGI